MEWVAFWGMISTAIGYIGSVFALHLKNKSQDAKIDALEKEHKECHEERMILRDRLKVGRDR